MFSPIQISQCSKSPIDLINLNNIHLNTINSCGYCLAKSIQKTPKNWNTSGFSCPQMSCETYQLLLEQGWRRCGTYYYKPDLSKCCCRPYTIRLEVQKYKVRSSHLQSLKKFWSFLKKSEPPSIDLDFKDYETESKLLIYELFDDIINRFQIHGKGLNMLKIEDKAKIKISAPFLKKKRFFRTANLAWLVYFMNESMLKAEGLEFKDFLEKLKEFISEFMSTKTGSLAISCHNSGYISIKIIEIKKTSKIQDLIEETLKSHQNSLFELKIVPAEYEEESYEMYRKYSKAIHNISESKSSYRNFLCLQALKYENIFGNYENFTDLFECEISQYGCYHMKYYYNKNLIAIGVVDVLPKGLSSVYFFYDPDYKKNSLGVIGSLREINFVSKHNQFLSNFQYYYMGYYIQSSKKMKYKGDFEPSELLCPTTLKWVTLNNRVKTLITLHKEDPILVEEKSESKKEGLIKEYFNNKKIFFNNEWILIDGLQKRYISYFMEVIMGLGSIMSQEIMDRMEFTIV